MAELQRPCRECGALVDVGQCAQSYSAVICPECVRAEAAARAAVDRRLAAEAGEGQATDYRLQATDSGTRNSEPETRNDAPAPSVSPQPSALSQQVTPDLAVSMQLAHGLWWWIWRRTSDGQQVHACLATETLVQGQPFRLVLGRWEAVAAEAAGYRLQTTGDGAGEAAGERETRNSELETSALMYGTEDQEVLDEAPEAVVERILDDACQTPGEPFDAIADRVAWPIRVAVYRRMNLGTEAQAAAIAGDILERTLDDLDSEHADPDGDATEPSPGMRAAALEFGRAVVRDYVSWACEPTGQVIEVTRAEAERAEAAGYRLQTTGDGAGKTTDAATPYPKLGTRNAELET